MKCGVCKRPSNEVKKLITVPRGSTSFLMCSRCIEDANEALQFLGPSTKKKDSEGILPTPKELKALLDECVVSQDHTKVDLSIALYNHYKRKAISSTSPEVVIQKSNILIMGPSGCGKTELVRTIAQKLKVPLYIGDATRLTSTGYVGDDVDSLLKGLIVAANGDKEQAQWGIIFLDEADKISRKSGAQPSGYKDVSGESVQQALLKLVEGSKVPITTRAFSLEPVSFEFDTQNVLFIFAGAFSGIEDIVWDRLRRKSVGFKVGQDFNQNESSNPYPLIIEEDILKYGIIPELLGRLPIRTWVNPLSEEDLCKILTEPRNSLVSQYQCLFAHDGVTLEFEGEAIREIAKVSNKGSKSGARFLRSTMEKVLKPYAYELPGSSLEPQKLIITAKIVKNSC